ncbi:hypothetical protein Q31b_13750 [Novipirellula aureliae]|uniref:PEP-CTERM protein-sorting domain-containing protein n=1 Tax=Novipirellula aureliae TaxID=2527966 RepID=A0A5C6E2G8_9BACT|nr:choice-of-anchor M domain-containing protein [Novipirellula aureliae]TWU43843.1 hypothetical protein Q31b_13750 [Novipirellula aureliae]
MKKMTQSLIASVAFLFLPAVARAAVVEYVSGHADIGLAYEEGELELHYHFGSGAILDGMPLADEVEYAPDEAYINVGMNAHSTTTADVSFLGTTTGDPVWILPQSGTVANAAGLPFLGLASEELDSADFSTLSLSLSSFNGPGEFALWQSGNLGQPSIYWQTYGGIDSSDVLAMGVGGHDHYNFGFTAQGVYDLELTAVGNLTADAGGGSVTDTGTFRFVVGSVSAVPEPSSLAAMTGATALCLFRRRSRKTIVK